MKITTKKLEDFRYSSISVIKITIHSVRPNFLFAFVETS